jgi:hypothetical protein
MLRHIKYSDAERQLAGRAREVAMNRDVLYHGTRYAQSILKTGVLFHSLTGGDPKVCLTRSAEVAASWALVDRDDDEGRGSIFILDRQSLERRRSWLAKRLRKFQPVNAIGVKRSRARSLLPCYRTPRRLGHR